MPSLADRILELDPRTSDDGMGSPAILQRWKDAISRSQCFRFDDQVMQMASDVASSVDLKRQYEARKFARSPYEDVWLEWNPTFKIDFDDDPFDDRPTPTQIGCLVMSPDGGTTGCLAFAWYHNGEKAGVSFCPAAYEFDYKDKPDIRFKYMASYSGLSKEEMFKKIVVETRAHGSPLARKILNSRNGVSEMEWMTIWGHLMPVFSPLSTEFWSAIRIASNGDIEVRDRIYEKLVSEIEGDANLVTSLLAVFNSKNLISSSADRDVTKLNKHRGRNGKPLLRSFTRIRLNLSRAMQRKIDAVGGMANYQPHMVRGHWKVRKTGIYWWSPFARGGSPDGNPGPVRRTHYEVHA